MRLAVSLLTLFPGRVGGSETYVRGLLGELVGSGQLDGLTVLANRHVAAAYSDRGLPLERMPRYRSGRSVVTRFLAMNAGRYWPVLEDGRFDVLHYAVTVPIPRVRTTPTVLTLADVLHHELPSNVSVVERSVRRWAYDDAARHSDVVMTISQHARASIVHHLGIAPERVVVASLGVDHGTFTPDGPVADGMPERYLIYPANFWPHKNHARLLAAFESVMDESLHLVLTGQAEPHHALTDGHRRVHVLGRVPVERLAALYRGAVALIYPSLFEGFGLPVPEAMACGAPVVCSNCGAVAEVAGDAAITFDPADVSSIADAIVKVSRDETLRSRLRVAGLAHAAGFTWKRCAEAHLLAYRAASER